MSLGINDLLGSDEGRMTKASGCKVEFQGKRYELKPETLPDNLKNTLRRATVNTYYIVFKFTVISDTGHKHQVIIRTLPKSDLSGPVQVFCDCQDFKFRCAYELNSNQALFRSPTTDAKLGESITTPPKKPGQLSLCKHVLAAVTELTNNLSYYLG
jgi:hypothetical protein